MSELDGYVSRCSFAVDFGRLLHFTVRCLANADACRNKLGNSLEQCCRDNSGKSLRRT